MTTHLSVVDVGVEGEVTAAVSHDKVVLGQLGLAGVEGGLVAQQEALVADDGGGVDQGTAQVNVHVGGQGHQVVLVLSLNEAGLSTVSKITNKYKNLLTTHSGESKFMHVIFVKVFIS